jgi:hypothetical protein
VASELVTAGNFLQAVAAQAKAMKSLPPVEAWNPPYCGEIDMAIRRDGSWAYMGTPIGRPALVRLFSTILRREEDGRYVLVTPAERVGILVEDAPFLAVLMSAEGEGKGQTLRFTTNVADEVSAGPDHGLRFVIDPLTGEVASYVHLRGRLEARINRPVYYDLVALGCDELVSSPVYGGGVAKRRRGEPRTQGPPPALRATSPARGGGKQTNKAQPTLQIPRPSPPPKGEGNTPSKANVGSMFGVWSGGHFFPMIESEALK